MRKIVNGLFIITCTVSLVFAGDFVQTGVAPPYIDGADTLFGGVPGSASRGALVGTDLDQDGLREVWVTSYSNGGQVFCFEEAGTDTLAFVWASAEITADYSSPRDVHTGDLDSDGKGEIIFHVGRWTGESNPDAGLHVYEWDGINDNGYGTEAAFRVDFMNALNDSLAESRVEGFSVGDIDGDGQDEILLANNGTSDPVWGTQDGSTPYSNDRFIIMSVSGDIGGFGATIVEEYSMSPRDVDKDGVRENALGGGSPQDIIICDTDGDGNLEAACFSWNNLAVFFIEATGPDAYTIGDTTYRKLGISDDWTLGASAADNDGDGKDEVYVTGYYDGSLFVITDSDDDATSLDQTGGPGDWTGNSEIAIIHEFGGGGGFGTSTGAGPTNSGMGGVIHGGTAGVSDINLFELAAGGNPLDSLSWTHSSYALDDATSGWSFKAKAWFPGTGNADYVGVLLPYQAVNDTLDSGELDPAGNRVFRLAEWDESVTVRDITFIMPEDYKLAQNFPNPFNATTRIEYRLPLQNTISLTIYNMLGQEIVKLVDTEYQRAGNYSVLWNGKDANGMNVTSGMYIYALKFGNFEKSKQMMLLK
ncbi:MAG TPA: T9SS type A sorting domain-containing protein, partial [Candidatus Marinimicrobia bacterium]|nr:T9SS type A sorting domain-containing protein [Candidatus Neomarinimicrobiota bacterium]